MQQNKLRILNADDDAHFQSLLMTARVEAGLLNRCELNLVADGTEVLEYIEGKGQFSDRTQYPLPDLLLIDARMSMMDAVETLTILESLPQKPWFRTIVLSNTVEDTQLKDALAVGALGCAEKPMTTQGIRELLSAIVCFSTDVLALPRQRTWSKESSILSAPPLANISA